MAVGGIAALLCCCTAPLGLVFFGVNVIEAEIREQVRDNPKMREHIGEIESFETDIVASAAADEEVYRYNVRGTKGAGELTVEQYTDDNGDEVIRKATLRLKDGMTIPIVP